MGMALWKAASPLHDTHGRGVLRCSGSKGRGGWGNGAVHEGKGGENGQIGSTGAGRFGSVGAGAKCGARVLGMKRGAGYGRSANGRGVCAGTKREAWGAGEPAGEAGTGERKYKTKWQDHQNEIAQDTIQITTVKTEPADIALTISDRVEFFPISYRPLNELIAAVGGGKFQGFTCDLGKAAQGSIVMEKDNYLGIGTFKTAHPAYLTLMHLTMYVRRAKATSIDPDGWVVAQLTSADEYRKILIEANILQWPSVAIVHEQPSSRTASTKSTICRLYLVEELIDEKLDGFHKFIHNENAVSALSDSEDKSLHEMVDFLSFTQYVQYYKTAGMVYLSELQGTLERLTDPQIMTSPLHSSISDGIDLFGDGNVPAAFAAFPAEHACNKFCAWFKLPQPDTNNATA
ncbi:hypothetical protein B0H14DRAFT_3675285 [Mycena olivaceomarginata]|nr:hypothetical protein B0H14DRAFT_3675285 [Mycena olivaceomarginata]